MTKARNENASAATEASSTNQKSLYKNCSVTDDDAQPSDWQQWRANLGAVRDADIQPAALKLLLVNMATYANAKTGRVFPSVSTLANACSCSDSHVKRLLKTALGAGLIEVAKKSTGGFRKDTVEYVLDVATIQDGYAAEIGTPLRKARGETLAAIDRTGATRERGPHVNGVHQTPLTPATRELPRGPRVNPNKGRKTGEENPASPGGPFGGPASPAPEDRSLEEAQRWLA